MTTRLVKDFFLRQTLQHTYLTRILLKSIQRNNMIFSPYYNRLITKKSHYLTFISRFRDYCIISGKGRGIVSKYRVSRNFFKLHTNYGLFFSVRKSSW